MPAYAGELVSWVMQKCGWILQTVLRPVGIKGFVPLLCRWVVGANVRLVEPVPPLEQRL